MIDEVAARLWRAEAENAGTPQSGVDGRTAEAFAEQSEELKARWRKFARAALGHTLGLVYLDTPEARHEYLAASLKDRVQHVKRGSTYRVIGRGKVQTDTPLADYAEVVVYQGESDGLIWVRPVSEFDDGRFQPAKEVR